MPVAVGHQDPAFVHEAFLYRDSEEFVLGLLRFIRAGTEKGEPVFVVLSAEKIARLKDALGEDADHVLFADMAEIGANPARIIAAWRERAAGLTEYGAQRDMWRMTSWLEKAQQAQPSGAAAPKSFMTSWMRTGVSASGDRNSKA